MMEFRIQVATGLAAPVTALRAKTRAKSKIDCPLRPLNSRVQSRISNSYS